MKKFISMVMAAAMVVSLVPATAFAADNTCSMKVVKAAEATKDAAKAAGWDADFVDGKAQIQITIGQIDTLTGTADTYEVDLDFDGAKVATAFDTEQTWTGATWTDVSVNTVAAPLAVKIQPADADDETITLKITEADKDFATGDIITLPLNGNTGSLVLKMKSIKEGATASVAVSGDLGSADAKVFASVLGQTLKIKTKKLVEVGEENYATLNKVTIETAVGSIATGTVITLKLNSGFEFKGDFDGFTVDGAKATMEVTGSPISKLELTNAVVEAVSAKAGDVATIKVSAKNWDAASCDVMEVIDSAVKVTVDEDADVPEIYSGTNVGDYGLTSEGEHEALVVTIEETVEGAWNTVKGMTISLPEGVYVTSAELDYKGNTGDYDNYVDNTELAAAYKKGDYEEFVFGRRAWDVKAGEVAKFDLKLVLVAEPGFVGDAVLKVEGDGIGSHEVVIAKFVAPYTVEAAANDVIIDYRNTEIKTDVVVKEAEAGLWADANAATKATFTFTVDKSGDIAFEDDATITADEASEMELKAESGRAAFSVKEESNEEAAVVTINGIELYLKRDVPAGAYDLNLTTSMAAAFLAQDVFAPSADAGTVADKYYEKGFTHTVKEGWVNVVTAGRDKDDASFTKKVVVPVGESYLIAGEETVALDVPAYINANGYTMLPVRAVATALGIHNNNVIWSQAAKQVTILYGQRIITMTVGQAVVYVNGSAIPASAAVEVVDGRAFLGLRDLANALGVVEINWDAATSTATLN